MDFTLADGGRIPAVGLGTWPMGDAEAEVVVARAIDDGYRLVDTAFAYGNEQGVGAGVRASGVPREDIFVTTKFNAHSHSVDGVAQAWEEAATKMQLDYFDLFLVHWPVPWQGRFLEAWEGLVALHATGKVRHIGVSSFLPEHLDPIIAATGVVPVLNQMQINPRYQQLHARAHNAEKGIHTQAWSPLGQGTGLLENPDLVAVAQNYGITVGELVIAWNVHQGMSAVPKSSDPMRQRQNLHAASIVLEQADVDAINAIKAPEPDIKHPNSFGH